MSLASIPSPTTSVWHLGPLPIRAYALCIVIGIVLACLITQIRLQRRGGPEFVILDLAVWAVLSGIVGARLYHILTDPELYFGAGRHPIDALKIWNGGLGIWGAVAGGAFGVWLSCRRKGIPFTVIADAAAPALPVAQAIGRWGNYFNNELFGRPTKLPWGLQVNQLNPDGTASPLPGLYHPTFLYESLWDLGVALLVWLADRRYRFGRGRAFALYVMAYVVGRFWVEALRVDHANHFLGLRLNDWVSIVVFVAALAYFVLVRGPRLRLTVGEDGKLTAVPDTDPDAPGAGSAAVTEVGTEPAGSAEPPPDDDPAGTEPDTTTPAGPPGQESSEAPAAAKKPGTGS